MSEGRIHERIRAKQSEAELLASVEEIKASYPDYEYGVNNPPPKDPLLAVTDLENRRQKWFKDNFGDKRR